MGIKDMVSKLTNWPPTLENSGRAARKDASLDDILGSAKPAAPLISTKVEPTVDSVEVPATTEEKPVDNFLPPVEEIPQDKEGAVEYLKRHVFAVRDTPYLTVMKTYGKLGEFIEDESKRVRASLAITGIDEKEFLDSIEDHLVDLDEEKRKMTEKAEAMLALQTESFRAEVKTQNTMISDIDEQLAALNASITRLLNQKTAAANRIGELNAKINEAEDGAMKNAVVDEAAGEIRNTIVSKKTALGK